MATGDQEAFRSIFHHYNKMLQPFVVKLTGSPEAAEEVLQEVFLKIWVHRQKLVEADDPKAYIIRIVSNESYDYLRARARNKYILKQARYTASVTAPSPEQSYQYRETQRLVHEAVSELPAACQLIYRMSREQYKRIPEIASELHLSDHTVKNQLVKALKFIRLYLGNVLPFLIIWFLSRR